MAERLVHRSAAVLLAALALVVCVLAVPEVALARSYEISSVDIDATVEPDGTLLVTETRTFDFDGSFNGVYWDIPTGYNRSNGKNVEVSVLSAGEGTPGSLEPFTQDGSGGNGSYEVENRGSSVKRVTLYSAQSDDRVSFTISYEASTGNLSLEQCLRKYRERDLRMKSTTVGPHRDDLCFTSDQGIDVRRFGSQGQQRTAALALKMSEIELVKQVTGDTPVLLLDDVLSELDKHRQNYLLDSIHDIQTIITCTGLDEFVSNRFSINKIFHIKNGHAVNAN